MDSGAGNYRRFLEGDREAIGQVVDLYREGLIFFIYRYVKDLDIAEDLAEDVFVELLLKHRAFDFRSSLKTWIYAVGRNKAVDFLRKNAVHKRILEEREIQNQSVKYYEAEVKSLEEQVIKGEEKKALYRGMASIRQDYREALYLVYFEELSYEETAQIMKKKKKQVENLVYRGKIALRIALEKEKFGDEE